MKSVIIVCINSGKIKKDKNKKRYKYIIGQNILPYITALIEVGATRAPSPRVQLRHAVTRSCAARAEKRTEGHTCGHHRTYRSVFHLLSLLLQEFDLKPQTGGALSARQDGEPKFSAEAQQHFW